MLQNLDRKNGITSKGYHWVYAIYLTGLQHAFLL